MKIFEQYSELLTTREGSSTAGGHLAITEKELHRLTQERALYLRLLALNEQDDLEPLLQEALNLIVEVTRSQHGYLALYDDKQEPRWWLSKNFSEEERKDIQERLSHGVISAVLSSGKSVVSDASQDPRFKENESVLGQDIHAVLCVPIGSKKNVGVLYLQGKSNPTELFSKDDQYHAELFSKQLATLADRLILKQLGPAQDPTATLRAKLRVDSILGRSEAMTTILQQIEKASRFELTILLRGESGTGKTAIARAIHENSARAKHPFLELNCAAIPEALFESELFGALPGSHSTAIKKMTGKIAAAEGGTLFLDEVGELPLVLQAKLLQLLQSKEYFPLGATKPEKANIRLMAATNAPLEEAVKAKRFREDLLYRLQVMTINIPSLAERRADIALLLSFFCAQTCKLHSLEAIEVSFETVRLAEISEWPGNIRQLANAVEVATISAAMESSPKLLPRHMFPDAPTPKKNPSYQEAIREFQKQLLTKTLNDHNWNVSETAKRLGLNRSYTHELIQGFGLRRS